MTQERDAELSALLDGALGAHDEAALRSELSRDPALAARLAELAHVDEELRALPARPVPRDLRARLQAKLDADAAARSQPGVLRGGAFVRIRRRRAWAAGFAAAAAAALVALIGLPGRDDRAALNPNLAVTPNPVPDGAAGLGPDGLPPREEVASRPDEAADLPAELGTANSAIARETPAPERSKPALETAAPVATEEIVLAHREPAVEFEPELPAFEAEPRTLPRLAAATSPPLLIEVSDDEAEALDELELGDTGIVAVLDLLGELDALEAGAS